MAKKKRKIVLQTGDVISILLDSNEYAFARVIAKDDFGDVIEVFNYFSHEKHDYDKAIKKERLHYPHIIDSYSIFFLGEEGFDVVKNGAGDFVPDDYSELKFNMGPKELPKFYYLDGRQENIDNSDNPYPWYSSQSDFDIKRLIDFWRNKNK
jgi:hypothetical protein